MKRAVVLYLGLLAAASTFAAETGAPALQLDGSVVPKAYRLELTVIPNQDTFQGSIEIDVTLRRATSVIWLNATGLRIESSTIRTPKGVEHKAKPLVQPKDFLGLETATAVPAGSATLRLQYSGNFRKAAASGLFTRRDAADWYAYTQFEPLDARAAFPCFDEPEYRAPWNVTLHVPAGLKAFANAPAIAESIGTTGLKTVRFLPTPPISTYLVAFAVGPFDVVDAGVAGRKHTPLRIIVPRGRAAHTKFAREVTPRIVEELERYFGIPFPFDKLDQVAFPGFGGGMENAGLITYGEFALVAVQGTDNAMGERDKARIIAHEIAHQWFGDLTTMRWWDDLWLNEGFANWMEVRVVERLFPKLGFLMESQQIKSRAIAADSLTSARRIRNKIENAGDIGQAFDTITYQKGGSVIAMFEHFVGEEAFRKGVSSYLRKHAWKNTTSGDFLRELSLATGKDVARPFSTFLDRTGVPLVRVDLSCSGATPQVNIRQERLLPVGSIGDRNGVWQVPLCLRYPTGSSIATECTLLTDPKQSLTLPKAASCPDWINADADGAGYYQVLYEGETRRKQPSSEHLTAVEQASQLRSSGALFKAGLIGPEEAMHAALALASSNDPGLVSAVLDIFVSLADLVRDEDLHEFRRLFGRTFATKVSSLGLEGMTGEDSGTTFLRAILLPAMLSLGDNQELDSRARKLVMRWLAEGNKAQTAVTTPVLRGVAAKADAEFFGALEYAVENWTVATDRLRAVSALSGVRDPQLVGRAMQWILVSKQPAIERMRMLTALAASPPAADTIWKFVQQNYSAMVERLPEDNAVDRGTVVIRSLRGLCTAKAREEVHGFFADNSRSMSGGPRALAQTLEQIDLCVARRNAQEAPIAEYLRKQF